MCADPRRDQATLCVVEGPGDQAAEDRFKEAKEAYDVLSDPRKRSAYDQFGHAGVDPSVGGAASGAGFRDIFDEVFGDIFGTRSHGSKVYRGADLRYDLELSLEEAVFGTSSEIHVPKRVACEECDGSGAGKGCFRTWLRPEGCIFSQVAQGHPGSRRCRSRPGWGGDLAVFQQCSI